MSDRPDETNPGLFDDIIETGEPFPDDFGTLDPSCIKTLKSYYGPAKLSQDEIGFCVEDVNLRYWARLLVRLRGTVNSRLVFQFAVGNEDAILSSSDGGSVARLRTIYPEPARHVSATERIELILDGIDLIEVCKAPGVVKSFRYSRSKKKLRVFGDLFERPIKLLPSEMYHDREDTPRLNQVRADAFSISSEHLHDLLAPACRILDGTGVRGGEQLDYIEVSQSVVRAGNARAALFVTSPKLDASLDFKARQIHAEAILFTLPDMRHAQFSKAGRFNIVSDEQRLFAWENPNRKNLPETWPEGRALGTLRVSARPFVEALKRVDRLLPGAGLTITIPEPGSMHAKCRATDQADKKKKISFGITAYFECSSDQVFPIKVDVVPEVLLPAFLWYEPSNIELKVEERIIRVRLRDDQDMKVEYIILSPHGKDGKQP